MQVAYMILQKVSPVTHSVGNCVKRVVVIVSSVIFFRTPVSPINALGKIAILWFQLEKFEQVLYTFWTCKQEKEKAICIKKKHSEFVII